MPRRKSPPKRITPPDNKYQSLHVAMLNTFALKELGRAGELRSCTG